MSNIIEHPVKSTRKILPEDFKIKAWNEIEPYFSELESRNLDTLDALTTWLQDLSELESVVYEEGSWRYIRMTCDTGNKEIVDAFNFYVSEIEPKIAPIINNLNKKFLNCPHIEQLGPDYQIMIRNIKMEAQLYRQENVPIQAKLQQLQSEYGAITGAMTIEHEGKELTLQQATNGLKDLDRTKRETVYRKICSRRAKDASKLDALFDELIKLRHQIALNAGYQNYRDYAFDALGRFDYGVPDCRNFHESIREEILPLNQLLAAKRRQGLGLETLKPWDMSVDPSGQDALIPFQNADELLTKSIAVFDRIRPYFGECLRIMKSMSRFDLDSRIGKAPGGYNCPLEETGVPFIFMNASGSFRDLTTMMHEGGHAIHSFSMLDLSLKHFRDITSETAELASMSMELISMKNWDVFFADSQELKRAKQQQLEQIITIFPWIALIDHFQHWIYENPTHTATQRRTKWAELHEYYYEGIADWKGEEADLDILWQKQNHLYTAPFYYVEYGMAQLGALAVWKNYIENPEKALDQYQAALRLGYTVTIPEMFKAAGIQFDFSRENIKELALLLDKQLNEIIG